MCKILAGIAITNPEKIKSIIEANKLQLELEPDGFGYYSDKKHIQALEYKWGKVDFSKYFIVHTRTATTGAVTPENAHTYQLGQWVFAHNGWTNSGYGGGYGLRRTNTDSFDWFKSLYQQGNITLKSVKALAEQKSFYGIGVLYNSSEERAIVFSRGKKCNMYTDDNGSGLLFSSYEIDNGKSAIANRYGLQLERNNALLMPITGSIYNQACEFDLMEGNVSEIIPIRYFYTGYQQQTYSNPSWFDDDDWDTVPPQKKKFTTKGMPVI